MLKRLFKAMGLAGTPHSVASLPPPSLPAVERSQIESLLTIREGIPQVDWGMADLWIARNFEESKRIDARRSVAAAWLDEVRDSLNDAHRRWRRRFVEGLGPVADDLAPRVATAGDKSVSVIGDALMGLRGEAPIPPFAIVAFESSEDYYSFLSHFVPDEGEWGTSGAVYINQGEECYPVIALPTKMKSGIEESVAHEFTHHALKALCLPLWIEEGLTQMMEERVTGHPNFTLSRERLSRHRAHWSEVGYERFLCGEGFRSPHGDEQELAYHLSQIVVRGLLTSMPNQFFAYARACRSAESDSVFAKQLGHSPEEMLERFLSNGSA
jgi:hypothetical protein